MQSTYPLIGLILTAALLSSCDSWREGQWHTLDLEFTFDEDKDEP